MVFFNIHQINFEEILKFLSTTPLEILTEQDL